MLPKPPVRLQDHYNPTETLILSTVTYFPDPPAFSGSLPPLPTQPGQHLHRGESAVFAFDTLVDELDEIGREWGDPQPKPVSPRINLPPPPQPRMLTTPPQAQQQEPPQVAPQRVTPNQQSVAAQRAVPMQQPGQRNSLGPKSVLGPARTPPLNSTLAPSHRPSALAVVPAFLPASPAPEFDLHPAINALPHSGGNQAVDFMAQTFDIDNALNSLDVPATPGTRLSTGGRTSSSNSSSPAPASQQYTPVRTPNGSTSTPHQRMPSGPAPAPTTAPLPQAPPVDLAAKLSSAYDPKFCAGCAKELNSGSVFRALERRWHTNCFRCTNCQTLITSSQFLHKDNMPFCMNCRFVFNPRCLECNGPIEGPAVKLTDSGAMLHPTCYSLYASRRGINPNM